jgi:hypothetical protein
MERIPLNAIRILKASSLALAATLVFVPITSASAAAVTLTASDDTGATSFNTSLHWSNSAAPALETTTLLQVGVFCERRRLLAASRLMALRSRLETALRRALWAIKSLEIITSPSTICG